VEAASTWQHDLAVPQPVTPFTPPVAPRRAAVLQKHGDKRVDPYYWLRQRANPEVVAHLEAENEYAAVVTAPSQGLEDRLYEEIVARIQQTDTSAPSFYKGFWHYTRTVEGLNYEIHCRRKGSMDAPEEVELDCNALAPKLCRTLSTGRSSSAALVLRRDSNPSGCAAPPSLSIAAMCRGNSFS